MIHGFTLDFIPHSGFLKRVMEHWFGLVKDVGENL